MVKEPSGDMFLCVHILSFDDFCLAETESTMAPPSHVSSLSFNILCLVEAELTMAQPSCDWCLDVRVMLVCLLTIASFTLMRCPFNGITCNQSTAATANGKAWANAIQSCPTSLAFHPLSRIST